MPMAMQGGVAPFSSDADSSSSTNSGGGVDGVDGAVEVEEVVSESDQEADEAPTQSNTEPTAPRNEPAIAASTASTASQRHEDTEDEEDVRILSPREAAATAAAAVRRALAGDSDSDLEKSSSPGAACGRKRKRPRVETRAEPTECTVCYDPCTISGRHRLVALKCGHLFGKKCIERWVSERKTCPNCATSVLRRDIRPLFSDHVAVVDNSGIEDMTQKFEAEKSKRLQLEIELAKARLQVQTKTAETTQLIQEAAKWKKIVTDLRSQSAKDRLASSASQATDTSTITSFSRDAASPSQPSRTAWWAQSQPLPELSAISPPARQSQQSLQTSLASFTVSASQLPSVPGWAYDPVFDVAVKEARVFDIAASCSFLCVGEWLHAGTYGVTMLSASDSRHSMRVTAHSMPVRDLRINKKEDLVMTVAFDGKLAVTSLATQSVVLQLPFPSDHRLGWSCALSDEDEFAMYCGFHDGKVVMYDMRKPTGGEQGIVSRFELPEKQPVHSLKLFPNQAPLRTEGLAAATFNGLSVWNDVSRLRGDSGEGSSSGGMRAGEPDSHATIGACCSLAANRSSPREVVVSSRTQGPSPAKHLVFSLSAVNGSQLTPTRTLMGHRTHPAIFRSATWTEANGNPVVASWAHDSKRVLLWDVDTQRVVDRLLPAGMSGDGQMPVVDVQHAVQGGNWSSRTALLGTLSAQRLSLYRRRNV